MLELIVDRLSLWGDLELRALARSYYVKPGADREANINALAAGIVASRDALPALHRAGAAGMVATVVTRRWKASGVTRWVRDAGGRPVPWRPGAVHEHVVSYRGTTPSGRSLIGCASCRMKPTDVPGGARDCPGFELDFVSTSIAAAIEGGVVYAPTPDGLPLPTPGPAVACLRCWRFGPWTKLDRAVRQRVCDACFDLPFPTARARGT